MSKPRFDDLVGLPFDPENRAGVDCRELARLVLEHLGIHPDAHLALTASTGQERARLFADLLQGSPAWKRIPGPERGALVLFSLAQELPGLVTHLGVCLGDGTFIHARRNARSSIERLDHPFWRQRLVEYRRHVG